MCPSKTLDLHANAYIPVFQTTFSFLISSLWQVVGKYSSHGKYAESTNKYLIITSEHWRVLISTGKYIPSKYFLCTCHVAVLSVICSKSSTISIEEINLI